MCLGIPMRIERVDGVMAECRGQTGVHIIDIALLPDARPGDHVLTFLGAGRRLIDAREAALIADALEAIDALMAGRPVDIARAFADLIEREGELPAHLLPDRGEDDASRSDPNRAAQARAPFGAGQTPGPLASRTTTDA